jgi:hypothetical protein
MTFREKTHWVVLVVGVATLVVYLAVVVPQVLELPVAEVDWVQPMLVAIVVFVIANVVGNVLAAASNPREADRHDERDREIDRYGERVGNWLVIAGSIVALGLAMAGIDQLWIANAIFLGGLAGALLSSGTKIAAYHGSFQPW